MNQMALKTSSCTLPTSPFLGSSKQGPLSSSRLVGKLTFMEDGTGMKQGLLAGDTHMRHCSRNPALGFLEPICPLVPQCPDPMLINEDLAPTSSQNRIFSAWDLTYLWLGLVVSVPNYYLAGSLVELGMSWWQGIGTVMLANMVTYVLLVLAGHPGTKYGIPFPVLARASFGIVGANIPALLRAFVACGWFGIETWIGGQAIFQLLNVLVGHGELTKMAAKMPLLGTSVPELGCFVLFWLMQMWIIWNGMQSIKELDRYSAPVLIVLTGALLVWAYLSAGGFGPMLAAPSAFGRGGIKEGQFWQAFFPALTANVGCWATLSLNIPDFTRYSRSQSDQVIGQASLPLFMAAFAFVGLGVTSATEVIYGHAISNPIEVLARIGGVVPTLIALVGIILATLTTNIAANVVATANTLVNLNPKVFSYRAGGICAALLSICFLPWKLLQSSHGFIYTWLVGYSALLGPIGGVILADYYVIRRRELDVDALYSSSQSGRYWYFKGMNFAGILALVAGILPSMPGFLKAVGVMKHIPSVLVAIYDGAWFVGFFIAALVYWSLTKLQQRLAVES